MSTPTDTPPSDLPQTYANALHLLSLLPTNKDVTSLFTAPAAALAALAADLNAAAIPEMTAWLARAGYAPADLAALRVVHVAGTKGKGSVCAFLTQLLLRARAEAEGEGGGGGGRSLVGPVGTYTSPHVASVRERILLDGAPISRDLFAASVFGLWARLSAAARRAGAGGAAAEGAASKPFYFRFLTLLALDVFLRAGVRSAVVECGIGGEYDATNVLPAAAVTAAVVARLGVDHVAMLGGTVEEIAWHKAGVLKEGVVGFVVRGEGEGQDGAMRVLRERAGEKGAVLREIDGGEVEAWEGVPGAALEGGFQKENMALAVAAARHHLRCLEGHDQTNEFDPFKLDDIPPGWKEALKSAKLRGRCETLQREGVEWFLDGAHTADSLGQLGRVFMSKSRRPGERRVLLFNQQERDVVALVKALVQGVRAANGGFDFALFTRNDVSAQPSGDASAQKAAMAVMKELSPETECSTWDNVGSAVAHIQGLATNGGGPCHVFVTGSFHLVRSVLTVLSPDEVE